MGFILLFCPRFWLERWPVSSWRQRQLRRRPSWRPTAVTSTLCSGGSYAFWVSLCFVCWGLSIVVYQTNSVSPSSSCPITPHLCTCAIQFIFTSASMDLMAIHTPQDRQWQQSSPSRLDRTFFLVVWGLPRSSALEFLWNIRFSDQIELCPRALSSGNENVLVTKFSLLAEYV